MNLEPSIKEILIQFLSGAPNMLYPKIELNIFNLDPVQATDSFLDYVDISNLQEAILNKVGNNVYRNYKIILKKWRFVFQRVPNSNEFYFDLESSKFKIEESFDENDGMPNRLAEDDDVLYAFEKRRRQEMRNSMKNKYPQRQSNPPRVKRRRVKKKRNSKMKPILKNTNSNKKRASKSYSRSRGRSASKERSFSRGRSNSRGIEMMELDQFDTLSIGDLSNFGDKGPAEYSYIENIQKIEKEGRFEDLDILSVTSNTDTLIVNDLINMDSSIKKKRKKKKSQFNSAKVNRRRSRSRSSSKKKKQAQQLQEDIIINTNLFRDRSSDINNRKKSKKNKNKKKKVGDLFAQIDVNELKGGIGKQGKFREMSIRRRAMRNKKFNNKL